MLAAAWSVLVIAAGSAAAAQSDLDSKIDSNLPSWLATYKHFHENPELSTQEKETSALLAAELKKSGYDVTDHFGRYTSPDAVNPLEPALVTVGSFHAGTKHNIIPDNAHLQLTVRTMRPEVREKVLAAITRITNGVAQAAGVPADRFPIIEVSKDNVPATINDPALTKRVAESLTRAVGKDNVIRGKPIMASDDFSLFALQDPKPPTSMFWLGASDPAKWKEAQENGTQLPSPHSSMFAPVPEPAIRTGVKAMSSTVLDIMKK